MRNRLTFSNVISILLEHKKKTYQQHQLVRNLFSVYLDDGLSGSDIYAEDNTMYSRWCTGARPIPMEILRAYENEGNFDVMQADFRGKIIPNLINETQARFQMERLIHDSRSIIGDQTADEMIAMTDNAEFFTAVVRYAILCNHRQNPVFSPDLSDVIRNRFPPAVGEFMGWKSELKTCGKLLQEYSVLFISGAAGIGKSGFARCYADRNRRKYTNLIYLHYDRDLQKSIAEMEFTDDTVEMSEETLFERHYKVLRELHGDTLIVLDDFNVLPEEDCFFARFVRNDFRILITTRCTPASYPVLELHKPDSA